jgi:hypothetical protein
VNSQQGVVFQLGDGKLVTANHNKTYYEMLQGSGLGKIFGRWVDHVARTKNKNCIENFGWKT